MKMPADKFVLLDKNGKALTFAAEVVAQYTPPDTEIIPIFFSRDEAAKFAEGLKEVRTVQRVTVKSAK
jgi:hypothetical protein